MAASLPEWLSVKEILPGRIGALSSIFKELLDFSGAWITPILASPLHSRPLRSMCCRRRLSRLLLDSWVGLLFWGFCRYIRNFLKFGDLSYGAHLA